MSESIKAKIVDYSVGMSKTNNLKVNVLFTTLNEDTPRDFTWTGSLVEGKAKEITLSTLVKLGLNTDDLTIFNKGISSGALDSEKEYELVLKQETYNGVTRLKINYIKLPGEADIQQMDELALKGALSVTTIKDELSAKLKKHPPAQRTQPKIEEDDVF